jgi:hypothetical protein
VSFFFALARFVGVARARRSARVRIPSPPFSLEELLSFSTHKITHSHTPQTHTHTHTQTPKKQHPKNYIDVGRNYLTLARTAAKPTEKEIIIDVPAALKLAFQGGAWPLAVFAELRAKTLTEKEENITVSPR